MKVQSDCIARWNPVSEQDKLDQIALWPGKRNAVLAPGQNDADKGNMHILHRALRHASTHRHVVGPWGHQGIREPLGTIGLSRGHWRHVLIK